MKSAGYSDTPLWKKLGFKESFNIRTIATPANYAELLKGMPEGVSFDMDNSTERDLIHFFTKDARELSETLPQLRKEIKQNGMIWVSWPKRASKVPTDVNEDLIRDLALKIGLVDVKVCAVDQIWSGLKLVIPVKDRN